MRHDSEPEQDYEHRYQITRHGQKVSWDSYAFITHWTCRRWGATPVR